MAQVKSTTARLHGRRLSLARAVWLATAALAFGLFIAGVPARFAELLSVEPGYDLAVQQLGISARAGAIYFMAIEGSIALAYGVFAFIIFWRRSDDWMALLVSFTLVVVGATLPPVIDAILPARPDLRGPAAVLGAISLGTGLINYYLFPDGRFVPRQARWLAAAVIAWAAASLGINLVTGAPPPDPPAILIYAVFYFSGLAAQVYRYRRVSGPLQRQQTKWALWGAVAGFTGFCIFFLPPVIVPSLAVPGYSRLVFLLIASPVYLAGLILIPLSLVFAALRYRLWDIDLLLSRSLVYGALTAGLGLLFLSAVVLLQMVFPRLGGSLQSGLALGATALVMGALFVPARRRLQAWVDRRFYPGALAPTLPGGPAPGAGLAAGMRFGPYEVVRLLGRGGMAEVYLGRHSGLGRDVAIKVLSPSLAAEADFRRRFEREARTVAALKHPNIVEVYDFGEAEGLYYMVMEHIAGPDLAARLAGHKRLSLAQAQAIAADVAIAIDYAHGQGVVHRDVKPSNVLLRPEEVGGQAPAGGPPVRAVLTDFGIARLVGGSTSTRLTVTGALGTLEYIAPEQIMAAKRVDGRADVYSLGVMLYEMITGRLPITGDSPGALVLAQLQQPPPDPRQYLPDLPAAAAEAMLRALAKEPEARFATAGEFIRALI